MPRMWAFWRRTIYLVGTGSFLSLVIGLFYYAYWYEAPTCFDSAKNGNERGLDCGGSCVRVCSFDVTEPKVVWSQAFEIVPGQYNAVAYVENRNRGIGSPKVGYMLRLSDAQGVITERSGYTILPPDSTYPIFEGRIMTGTRKPTETTFELFADEDTLWLPATMGREQFSVIERTLKDADGSPRLDARLSNNALVPARDVEVVATIFDSKQRPLTASRTVVPFFASRSTENIVFTWQEPIAKTVRSCEVPTDVILAIDLSGSMNDDGANPPEPISSVLKAASSFVSRLKTKDQVGVVTYATNATIKEALTNDRTRIGAVVQKLTIAKADESGSTNTGDAIVRAQEELKSSRHNTAARKVLVLLTDGLANAPGEGAEAYAIEKATALKSTGTEIYTIGLGEKVNESFLRGVATNNAHYFKAPTAGVVDSIYRTVTSALCEDGSAVIDIIPKTETNFAPLQ